MIYRAYQLTKQSSLFLGIVTVLNIVVVLLIIAEYRHVKAAKKRNWRIFSSQRFREAAPLSERRGKEPKADHRKNTMRVSAVQIQSAQPVFGF